MIRIVLEFLQDFIHGWAEEDDFDCLLTFLWCLNKNIQVRIDRIYLMFDIPNERYMLVQYTLRVLRCTSELEVLSLRSVSFSRQTLSRLPLQP
jgi:hypothetical protein